MVVPGLIPETQSDTNPMLLRVLVVEDEAPVRKMIQLRLAKRGLYCKTVENITEATRQLASGQFDVVLSDLNMPGGTGLDLASWMTREQPGTPLVLVTGANEVRLATRALKSGVSDYIVKPFDIEELLRSLNAAVEEKRNVRYAEDRQMRLEKVVAGQTEEINRVLAELNSTHEATLDALGIALESRDHETQGHSRRVANLARSIAQELGIAGQELDMIVYGSYLHDIGKIGIADAVLRKPGPLTAEEQASMRTHVELGHRMVASIPFLRPSAEIVLCHHEAFDGSGYPRCLRDNKIPIGARVFAVADTVDAITSDRPYRKARPFAAAKAEIQRCCGTQFDPLVVRAFLKIPESKLIPILSRGE